MSHPSSPKNGGSVESRRKLSKSDLPFYEPPPTIARTPSQIIREAREKIDSQNKINHKNSSATSGYVPESPSLIRTLNSNRPFTPREEKRTLFGAKSNRLVNERPPSSFSIGSKSFDVESRPLSGTRLSPIEKPPSASIKASVDTIQDEENDKELLDYSKLSIDSPKTTTKSRLAPLELSHDKKLTKLSTSSKKESDTNNKKSSIKTSKVAKQSIDNSKEISSNGSSMPNIVSKDNNNNSDELIDSNWKNFIEPILNKMEIYFKDFQVDKFCDSSDNLNNSLEQYQMFAKTCSKRATILKIIFKYLDTECDRIKIKISRIILNMKVSSNNLTNICRLLFSISRNTDNDMYFLENDIIDSLLSSSKRLDFKENSDSVVYFCGTIKNLSENSKILKKLSNKNVEEILTKIIKDLSNYYKKDNETMKAEAGHALVQLTVTLRNLADLTNARQKFLKLDIIEQLVYVLKYYTSDGELMLNVSRILSKLTLHSDCCQKLSSCESCYKSFIKIMIKHDTKQDLIVRIGFILGNLTSRDEEARTKYLSEKYSIDTLINILKTYFANDMQATHKEFLSYRSQTELENINENEPSPNEDVMIKIIRFIANLAINEDAGSELANKKELIDVLLSILETKDLSCEELIIDTIVTINNLSFYNSKIMYNYAQKLIDCLMKYLLSNNLDAILEVFRVFANLSRHQTIRTYLVMRKVNILSIAYLSSNNRELVYIVIGVLINIMTDPEHRFVLKQEKGVKKLIEILHESGQIDWQLSSMICKLLMNYSEKTKTNLSYSNFELEEEVKPLKLLLNDLLDERVAIRNTASNSSGSEDQENLDEYMNCLWQQDFFPVASLLLKRLNEDYV